MKITSILTFAALSSIAMAAHAAPVGNQPAESRVSPTPMRVAIGPSAQAVATDMPCGGKYKANVSVTNPGPGPLLAKIVFTVGNEVKTLSFEAAVQKDPHSLTITHDKAFNCQAPLGLPKVEVFHGDKLLSSRILTPKSFTAEKHNPQPPSPTPWLRLIKFSGNCGTSAQGQAMLFSTTGAPQTVVGDANFGGNPQFKPYNVVPNAQTAVMNAGSAPVDCQGASGLPAFHTFLQNPGPNVPPTDVLFAQLVTFSPG